MLLIIEKETENRPLSPRVYERKGMKITVLGARGSVAVCGQKYTEYGGATTCYLIETNGEAIFLDAGSGIMESPRISDKNVSIFLTHPHLDHLLGLPFFKELAEPEKKVVIYGMKRKLLSVKDQVDGVYSNPLWPVKMDEYPSHLVYTDLEGESEIKLSDATVSWIIGNHPGGSLIYKIVSGKKTIVFATDYEHSAISDERLIAFARDCDLLIYDGQYTWEEYNQKKGYGHSTMEHGVEIFKECNAAQLLITHHDPWHTDGMLRNKEKELQGKNNRIGFARAGEVIEYESNF